MRYAVLPANYTFTAADHGVHVFQVTLAATGSQAIIVTDTKTNSITGRVGLTVARAGQVTHFALIAMGPVTVGVPTTVLVEALDAFNNVVPGYTGTVQFTGQRRHREASRQLPVHGVRQGTASVLDHVRQGGRGLAYRHRRSD